MLINAVSLNDLRIPPANRLERLRGDRKGQHSIRINERWRIFFKRRNGDRLGLDIGVHPRRINEIVLGKRRITADTALRLARYFGNSPQFWLGLQTDYDLDVARDKLGSRLDLEVKTSASLR